MIHNRILKCGGADCIGRRQFEEYPRRVDYLFYDKEFQNVEQRYSDLVRNFHLTDEITSMILDKVIYSS